MEFLQRIPKLTDKYNFVIAIHQQNFKSSNFDGVNWENKLRKIDNDHIFVMLYRGEPYELLSASDLLITDISSLGLYFFSLLRPIIFVDNKDMQYELGSLIPELQKVSYPINNVSNLEIDIDNALNSFDSKRIMELSQKICCHLGNSWGRHEAELYDSLSLIVLIKLQRIVKNVDLI